MVFCTFIAQRRWSTPTFVSFVPFVDQAHSSATSNSSPAAASKRPVLVA
jgi:hypothetical protein